MLRTWKILIPTVLFFFVAARAEDLSIEDIIQRNVVEPCEKLNKPKAHASCDAKKDLRNVAVAATPSTEESALKRCDSDRQDVPENVKMESYSGKSFDVSKVSLEEAQDVFNYFNKQKTRYVLSGGWAMTGACAGRAQLIANDLIRDCRMNSGKVFVQPSRSLLTLGLGRNSLFVNARGRSYRWDTFHVANVIYVDKDGTPEPYVIDPVVFDKAVPLTEWEAKVKENDASASTYISSKTTLILDDIQNDDPEGRFNVQAAEEIIAKARREERIMQGK